MTLTRTLFSLVGLLLAGAAGAADYYVVTPFKGKTENVSAIQVSLNGYTLPGAISNSPYAGFDFKSVLQVTGDSNFNPSQAAWTISTGTLPAGLTLNANGTLTGTPTTPGTSSFSVKATYKTKSGEQAYQVVVANITVGLSAATLSSVVVGSSYSYDFKPLLSVTGDAAYTASQVAWSIVSGSLPAGLTLNASTGVVSGTPTAVGSASFTLQAAYRTKTGQQAYTLATISPTNSYNMVAEGGTLSLTAPAGTVFREVVFASYGTPTGTGPNYVQGSCHASNSLTQVTAAFLNKQTGSISASNGTFGDPCYGTSKRLAVVLRAY